MDSRCDTYSLRNIIIDLTTKFDGIAEIYIFGSRRHRTMSTRSDLDLLLRADHEVQPEDVRDFALEQCPVLDFFFVDRGIATSCANGSKVKARSNRDLVYRLDAIKIWDRVAGFSKVDIDWDFAVIKGLDPMMTTLISAVPLPSKKEAVAPNVPVTTEATGRSRWRDIAVHPISIIVIVGLAVAGTTFAVIRETRIVPLKEDVDRLQKQIDSLTKTNATATTKRPANKPVAGDGK